MKVFISWSKPRSQAYAEALRDWVAEVIHQVEPWMSSQDISKGQHWSAEIFGRLDAWHHGLVCVTRENMTEPWLNFEAGALAKSLVNGRIFPILVDLAEADLVGPLLQFQATIATDPADMFRLIESVNAFCPLPLDPPRLERSFKRTWPDFAEQTAAILAAAPVRPADTPSRPDDDIMGEVLETVRELRRLFGERAVASPPAVVGAPRPPAQAAAPDDRPAPLPTPGTAAHTEALAALRDMLGRGAFDSEVPGRDVRGRGADA